MCQHSEEPDQNSISTVSQKTNVLKSIQAEDFVLKFTKYKFPEILLTFFNNSFSFPAEFPELNVTLFNIDLKNNDFHLLSIDEGTPRWLNDNIINTFLLILQEISKKKYQYSLV